MIHLFPALALALAIQIGPAAPDTIVLIRPTRYDLEMKVDIPNQELIATAKITVANATDAPVRIGSFLLYRLLGVTGSAMTRAIPSASLKV